MAISDKNIHLHCPDCGHKVDLPPQRCPVCGDVMVVGTPKQTMSPVVVVLLLFFILGPFGFGMLWRSNRFSREWKIALTVITLVWTVYLAWKIWAAFSTALDTVMGSGGGVNIY